MSSGIKIVLALFTAFALFLLIGVIAPWQKVTTHIEVFASPEHCWDVYHDRELMGKWVADFKSIETLSGTGFQEGNEYKLTMMDKVDEPYEVQQKIIKLEKPKEFELEYENNLQKGKVKVKLVKTDLGTMLKSTNSYTNDNIFMRSLFQFLNGKVETATRAQLNQLKLVIEETPKSRYQQNKLGHGHQSHSANSK